MTEQERLRILYGDPGLASPERVPLRAGPLSLDYAHGDLRYIRWGTHEVVRRIYAAVRDENWGTVPLHLDERERAVEADRFRIVYEGHYAGVDKGIEFRSVVTLTGTPDGTVVFDFDGEAVSTFARNRIGICVLHPTPEVAGKFVSVTHADGHETSGYFPETISPHQPFFNIAALDYEIESGVRAHIAFSGDVFEMEDQRNWLDASFKTYSTPLALPMPVTVEAGTRVHQRVALSLRGAEARETVRATEGRRAAVTVSAAIDREAERLFRHPGLMLPPGADLPERLLPEVRALKPDHLRIDVDAAGDGWQAALARANERAAALGVDLLVGLRGAEALAGAEVPSLTRAAGWLLLQATPEGVHAARAALPGGARILAGSGANFTDLNRNRPRAEDIDGVFFAGNPQVHAFDSLSIMETPPTLGQAISTARGFHDGRIAVGPLALAGPYRGADPRHASLFGAAWYLSAFAAAADAGASRVTLCDVAGPRGALHADGRLTPIGSVLAELPSNPSHLAHVKVSDGHSLSGLALWANDGHAWLFVVNRTDRPVSAVLHGLGVGRPTLRVLDETTGGVFHTRDVEDAGDGALRLTLNPYAIVKYATERGR